MSATKARQSTDDTNLPTAEGGLSENKVFEVLSNQRRRYAFHYLQHADRTVYLRELSERVAAWENQKEIRELSSKELKRVKTALQQHHLPKMDENDFVTYDRGRETVRITDEAANLEVYLDVVPRFDVPWSFCYLGLSAASVVSVLWVWLDGPLFGDLPYSTLVVFITTTFLLAAIVHTYFSYSRLRLGTTAEPPGVIRQ